MHILDTFQVLEQQIGNIQYQGSRVSWEDLLLAIVFQEEQDVLPFQESINTNNLKNLDPVESILINFRSLDVAYLFQDSVLENAVWQHRIQAEFQITMIRGQLK